MGPLGESPPAWMSTLVLGVTLADSFTPPAELKSAIPSVDLVNQV
jgi:hypothetical protein